MSTRCQIGFYGKMAPEERNLRKFEALIYRHSDGYPDSDNGVIAELMPVLQEFDKVRGCGDAEYCAARTLQRFCNKYDNAMRENLLGMANQESLSENMRTGAKRLLAEPVFNGYGICNAFHGDIEYFYAVYDNRVEVFSAFGSDGLGLSTFDEVADHPERWSLIQTVSIRGWNPTQPATTGEGAAQAA